MRKRILTLRVFTLWILAGGCGVAIAQQANTEQRLSVAGRDFNVRLPETYDPQRDTPPLLLVLHGYSASGAAQERYLRLAPVAARLGLLYSYPDGSRNARGRRGWNAGRYFGNVYAHDSDDTDFLRRLIAHIGDRYSIDPLRVFVIGYSNGARMAYQLACTLGDKIVAIVAIAGAQLEHPRRVCRRADRGSSTTRVLLVRGTADRVASYSSGQFAGHPHPGAIAAARQWADYNDCVPTPLTASGPALVQTQRAALATTTISRYRGCRSGSGVELWTLSGAGHSPKWLSNDADNGTTRLAQQLLMWLLN